MRSEAAATIFSRSSAPPPALDQVEVGIDFVGAVDGEVEMVDLIERRQLHTAALGIEARRLRGRYADHFQPGLHALAEQLDEMLGGRAGAEAELHAVTHFLEGARRSLPLQLVHVHDAPAPEFRVCRR
ncbi:hypothetical protein ABIF20_001976 [Bradyrhizobium japonicum]